MEKIEKLREEYIVIGCDQTNRIDIYERKYIVYGTYKYRIPNEGVRVVIHDEYDKLANCILLPKKYEVNDHILIKTEEYQLNNLIRGIDYAHFEIIGDERDKILLDINNK